MIGAVIGALGGIAGLAGNLINQFGGTTESSGTSSLTAPQQLLLMKSLNQEWERAPGAISNLQRQMTEPGNEYSNLRNWKSDYYDTYLTAKGERNSMLGKMYDDLNPTVSDKMQMRFRNLDRNRMQAMKADMEVKENQLSDIGRRAAIDRALGASVKSLGLTNQLMQQNLMTNVNAPNSSTYANLAAAGQGLGGLTTSLGNLANEFKLDSPAQATVSEQGYAGGMW